jgi:predicted RNase H-like HicB family nuclease
VKTTFTVILTPEHKGGYSVAIPAFDGGFTQGDTFEQAMENARDVIEQLLACYVEDGIEIPVESGLGIAVGLDVDVPVPEPAHPAQLSCEQYLQSAQSRLDMLTGLAIIW